MNTYCLIFMCSSLFGVNHEKTTMVTPNSEASDQLLKAKAPAEEPFLRLSKTPSSYIDPENMKLPATGVGNKEAFQDFKKTSNSEVQRLRPITTLADVLLPPGKGH